VRRKITVVGDRNGATTGLLLAERDYAQVVLFDENPGAARARARDINEAAPALGCEPRVWGTDSWHDTAGSQIVVALAGERDEDAAPPAAEGLERIAREVKRRSPDAMVIVGAGGIEPGALMQATLFPRQRVIGAGPTAYSAALRAVLAAELVASARDVSALVLGGDGEDRVPVLSLATVAGARVSEVMSRERLGELAGEVCARGGDAVGPFAAAAAVREIVDAIVHDRGQVLACAVLCQGEYEAQGVFLGVPVRLGAAGVEEIVELALTAAEREDLRRAAEGAGGRSAAIPSPTAP
jgi:malate dehydrogenase